MIAVFKELVAHRDLAIVLAWRELVVRYKRSVLGVGWSLMEPLIMVGVYVAVFGYVFGAKDTVGNYWMYALLSVLAWMFLSTTMEQCATVLLDHSAVVKKTYFPRELLVFAVLISRASTLLVGLFVAFVALVFFQSTQSPAAWERAPFVLLGVVALVGIAGGAGLVLSALQVMLRDVLFLVRFALRIAFYACPIVYPVSRVPESWRSIYELNPMVALLWLFQSVSSPSLPPPSTVSIVSAATISVVVPIAGWALFRRLQRGLGDLL